MALIRRIYMRIFNSLSGNGATRALMAQIEGERGAARLGLRGRAVPVWIRLLHLVRGLPGPGVVVVLLLLIAPALVAPEWYAARLALLDHLPEAVWWLAGAGLSLAFGMRFQSSGQEFTRELIDRTAPPDLPTPAATGTDAALSLRAEIPTDNAPLAEWMAMQAGWQGQSGT